MGDCITASIDELPLAPNKRVNYTFGQVLGEDDFRQEQGHFEWKHRLSNLLLHGYGTVCGLHVTAHPVAGDVEIRVSPGYAVSPRGNWIWVDKEQCALLGEWLSKHLGELSPLPSVGVPMTSYVKLCYEECPSDLVPIAGQPCASGEETRAASRIHESFRAEFSWTPPPQAAEDHFRRFGDLLARVEVVENPLSPDDSEWLIELVRDLCAPASSPPVFSPALTRIQLWRETACETMRRALAVWATEVCPCFDAQGEDCILLACVHFSVSSTGMFVAGSVVVDNCTRPVLVPDRLKQEFLCLVGQRESGVTDHGLLTGLADDDHPQYWRHDGGRALTGDLSAGNFKITNLRQATAPGDAVPFQQAIKVNDRAGGDLTGGYPTLVVAGLQGRPVAAIAPVQNQILAWSGTRWEPHTPSVGVTDHGLLAGLNDDDHPQYHNDVRGDARYAQINHTHALDDFSDVNAPSPAEGQVLTWKRNQWVAATPSTAVSPYAIVAAGFFDSSGLARGLVFNGLTATTQAQTGYYLLQWGGYQLPASSHMYIVKGVPWEGDDLTSVSRAAIFQFVRFQSNGILVRVLPVGQSFDPAGFMVEISAFGSLNQKLSKARLTTGQRQIEREETQKRTTPRKTRKKKPGG